jgi:GNAT superfamily N-acetyltransferase
MKKVSVRRADPDDAEAIAAVLRSAFASYESSYTPAAFAATTPSSEEIARRFGEGPIWVALMDDAVVGTASVVPRGRTLYLRSMGVTRQAWGSGAGRVLLNQVQDHATSAGYASIELHTTTFLTRAIQLYGRTGFRFTDGELEDLFGTPLLKMTKLLSCEWRRGNFVISTDRARLDLTLIHAFLKTSYWAQSIPRAIVECAIDHSLPFGVYDGRQQVGFGRVISDYATFAYVADVFIVREYRGRKLSRWLMEVISGHPRLERLRRWILVTRDAHGLYSKVGFTPLQNPSFFMERHNPNAYDDRNA